MSSVIQLRDAFAAILMHLCGQPPEVLFIPGIASNRVLVGHHAVWVNILTHCNCCRSSFRPLHIMLDVALGEQAAIHPPLINCIPGKMREKDKPILQLHLPDLEW